MRTVTLIKLRNALLEIHDHLSALEHSKSEKTIYETQEAIKEAVCEIQKDIDFNVDVRRD